MTRAQTVAAILFLAGATALSVWSFSLDRPVRETVVASQKARKDWSKSGEAGFYRAVRKWGDWPWLMLGGGILLAGCVKCGNRKWTRIIAAAMIASTLSGILANTSRLTTGRTRPRASPEFPQGFYGLFYEGRLLVGEPKFNAFPSGHTATAFGLAWPVVFAAPAAGVVVLAGAALVAWSSIALGAHHPSDVTVSILLSLAVGWVVWRFVLLRGDGLAAALLARAQALRRRWRK